MGFFGRSKNPPPPALLETTGEPRAESAVDRTFDVVLLPTVDDLETTGADLPADIDINNAAQEAGNLNETRSVNEAASAGPNPENNLPNQESVNLNLNLNEHKTYDEKYLNLDASKKLLYRPAPVNRLTQKNKYPAWEEESAPIKSEQIQQIFEKLTTLFGFQRESMRNMLDHFMTQLDSRASRMSQEEALKSLHASYIGGENANYKKWYFAAQLDLDEDIGYPSMKLLGKSEKRNMKVNRLKKKEIKATRAAAAERQKILSENYKKINFPATKPKYSALDEANHRWNSYMSTLTPDDMVIDVALYLLIWGEANQVRFAPECLCFIYKCAKDHFQLSKNKVAVPEGHFLDHVITPIYNFLRDQVYKIDEEGQLRKRHRDHKDIIGYDDVNQLFWYPEGLERIRCTNKRRLVDIPLQDRYLAWDDILWDKSFHKTYRETRTWLHVATNFNRIWIIHFASYWFFTMFNSPTLYTKGYDQRWNNPPLPQVRLSVIALGGFLCCLIQMVATIAERTFVPSSWPGSPYLMVRFTLLTAVALVNLAPSFYVFSFGLETESKSAYAVAWVQFVIALATCAYFSYRPLARLFIFGKPKQKNRRYIASQTFTASYAKLTGRSFWFSVLLWWSIFIAKYLESYFFLTLSIRDPIRELSIITMDRCVGDVYLGNFLCYHQAHITLVLIYLTELVLFFLDTYLWYIICNCFFSMGLSFALGISIMSPWRNVFSRLPKRIYSKILATTEMEVKYKPKILVSQIWNAIIISMYREHLLPLDTVQTLLYQQAPADDGTFRNTLKSPSFFIAHDDSTFKSSEFFPPNSEAERRVSFFAQSLSTPIPEPVSVECMPTFTVLIPHYSEKILLTLREIIKENDDNSRITLLEYLKKLYPTEWECFVKDTKLMVEEITGKKLPKRVKYTVLPKTPAAPETTDGNEERPPEAPTPLQGPTNAGKLAEVLPRLELAPVADTTLLPPMKLPPVLVKGEDTIRFEDEVADYMKRTHRRRLLGRSPLKRIPPDTPLVVPSTPMAVNPEIELSDDEDEEKRGQILREDDLPFYCIGFKDESPEFTLRTRIWASLRSQTLYRTASGFANYTRALKVLYRVENPEIVRFYLDNEYGLDEDLEAMAARKFKMIIAMQRLQNFCDEEKEQYLFLLRAFPEINVAYLEVEEEEGQLPVYYSCLVDGNSKFDDDLNRVPIYRIRLSGNPILGDGKSDNQNHLLIFYRGEYIQVVDANQDNYLEECMKIRSVLAEFEEMDIKGAPEYVSGPKMSLFSHSPVAIVGAREYIFSENTGVLGDVAAGKEQTFGTLFARTLAEIGGKLHYGHPDFLNAIYMTTRGGIAKAQRGLHLNEDIYAGMTALLRGGRIKHCDYYQCGKGRDLGFSSILNFTTKIGAGMGEQLLSREYYYLGTQLPLDRFLSFYYAHLGFHINNLFIVLSVQMFMIVLVNLGAISHESIPCWYNKDVPFTDLHEPLGCYMIQPVLNWVTIFIFSVFLVFFISFVPLIIQELTERGIWKALSRLARHLLSLSPFFEVFVCQIYANALLSDVTFGGAKYISSGRGFAMSRERFFDLFSRFSSSSIYSGARLFLMLLFASVTIWQPALLWFWISLVSMCFAPFIFNPHQFCFEDFFVDYRILIHWLSGGNSKPKKRSWSHYLKLSRSRYTGFKYAHNSVEDISKISDARSPRISDLCLSEIIVPFLYSSFLFSAYMFVNSQNGVQMVEPTNAVLRLLILVVAPLLFNALFLLIEFIPTFIFGCCGFPSKTFKGRLTSTCAHCFTIGIHLVLFEVIWFLEGWNFVRTLSCLMCVISIQEFLFSLVSVLILSKEFKYNVLNVAWWTGDWRKFRAIVGSRCYILLQPFREYTVKIMEMSQFAGDFVLTHWLLFIQFPLVLFPYVDEMHTTLLLWMRPSKQFNRRVMTMGKKKRRKEELTRYFFLFMLVLVVFLSLLIVPVFTHHLLPDVSQWVEGTEFTGVIQPNGQWNDDTGANATFTAPTKGPMPQFQTAPW